jgi:hypothetical protein
MSLIGGPDSSSKKFTTVDTLSNVASEDSTIFAPKISLARDSKGTFEFSDHGAIERAFQFANESLGLAERSTNMAQMRADDQLARGFALVDEQQSGGAQRVVWLSVAGLAVLALFIWKR